MMRHILVAIALLLFLGLLYWTGRRTIEEFQRHPDIMWRTGTALWISNPVFFLDREGKNG